MFGLLYIPLSLNNGRWNVIRIYLSIHVSTRSDGQYIVEFRLPLVCLP